MTKRVSVINGGAGGPPKDEPPTSRSAFADAEALKRTTAEKLAELGKRAGPQLDPAKPPPKQSGRRFVQFDETWREVLFPHLNPIARLALVLLARADFERETMATSALAKETGLIRQNQHSLLKKLETLGFAR